MCALICSTLYPPHLPNFLLIHQPHLPNCLLIHQPYPPNCLSIHRRHGLRLLLHHADFVPLCISGADFVSFCIFGSDFSLYVVLAQTLISLCICDACCILVSALSLFIVCTGDACAACVSATRPLPLYVSETRTLSPMYLRSVLCVLCICTCDAGSHIGYLHRVVCLSVYLRRVVCLSMYLRRGRCPGTCDVDVVQESATIIFFRVFATLFLPEVSSCGWQGV